MKTAVDQSGSSPDPTRLEQKNNLNRNDEGYLRSTMAGLDIGSSLFYSNWSPPYNVWEN